jgi:hypothetical protein
VAAGALLLTLAPTVIGDAGALLLTLGPTAIGDAGAAAGGGGPQEPQAAPAARIAVGDQAPDFELRSLEGARYRLGDLRGEKTAIVIFFRGTW